MSEYKAIGYHDWELIVARAGELYDRQRKSKRGISGQGIFREDGHEYWYAVAAQERIAAALNAQAGVVEALRPLAEAVERLDNAKHGNDFVGTICAQSQVNEAARAALAAVKGTPEYVRPDLRGYGE